MIKRYPKKTKNIAHNRKHFAVNEKIDKFNKVKIVDLTIKRAKIGFLYC